MARASADEVSIYGSPGQLALLFESIARLVTREPMETFADQGVRDAARGLTRLIEECLAETPGTAETGGPAQPAAAE